MFLVGTNGKPMFSKQNAIDTSRSQFPKIVFEKKKFLRIRCITNTGTTTMGSFRKGSFRALILAALVLQQTAGLEKESNVASNEMKNEHDEKTSQEDEGYWSRFVLQTYKSYPPPAYGPNPYPRKPTPAPTPSYQSIIPKPTPAPTPSYQSIIPKPTPAPVPPPTHAPVPPPTPAPVPPPTQAPTPSYQSIVPKPTPAPTPSYQSKPPRPGPTPAPTHVHICHVNVS